MRTNALFVYGTLMRGQSNHFRLKSATAIKVGTVCGRLLALREGYPALVPGAGRVHGEVCRFSDLDALLLEVDAYEDCDPTDRAGSLYFRCIVSVEVEDGSIELAWCYQMSEGRAAEAIRRGAEYLPDGRWRNRKLC